MQMRSRGEASAPFTLPSHADWRRGARLVLAAFWLALAMLVAGATSALANGHSKTLYLSYLADLSNFGPQEATGSATVNVGEGTVYLEASGLASLDGQVYEVWLVTADRKHWSSLGRFELAADGLALYEGEVEGVEVLEYRYLVLSVEPAEDADPGPSGQFSIGGVFPNEQALPTQVVQATEASAQAAVAGESTPVPAPPAYLPETGAHLTIPSLAPLVAVAVAGLAAVVAKRARGGR